MHYNSPLKICSQNANVKCVKQIERDGQRVMGKYAIECFYPFYLDAIIL